MRDRPYSWVEISKEAYAEIWRSLGEPRWQHFGSWTKESEEGAGVPGDQRTEWCIRSAAWPVLANETRNGVHRYFMAQPEDLS